MGDEQERLLIAEQALEIRSLTQENNELRERLSSIRKMLICVGGPLNDNKHNYSKEQLLLFFEIQQETEF